MNEGGMIAQARNGDGVPQEAVQRSCEICQSHAHQDSDCPVIKPRQLERRKDDKRGTSLRGP